MEDGKPQHRDLFAISPFCSVAESLILSIVRPDEAFRSHPSVYSYLWPQRTSRGVNYEHYYDGYQLRNQRIAGLLRERPGHIALIADIKQFYPSVDMDRARDAVRMALDDSQLDRQMRTAVDRCADATLGFSGPLGGLAIGPEFSHKVADLLLRPIDRRLSELYSRGYFRYVDDIVLVVPPSRIAEAELELELALGSIDLHVNPDKGDRVTPDDWLAHGPTGFDPLPERSFGTLVFRIKAYLAKAPDTWEELRETFEGQGVFLPLARLRAHAAKVSFQQFLLTWTNSGWPVAKSTITDTPADLASYALEVKRHAQLELQRLLDLQVPAGPTLRKWRIQHIRRWSNPLLYFCDDSELVALADSLARFSELQETVVVARALGSRNADVILDYPGPASNAFASLAASRNIRGVVTNARNLDYISTESAASMLMEEVILNSAEILQAQSPEEAAYLKFCAGKSASSREFSDFSYLDEIRCLQMSPERKSPKQILNSRFSDGESLTFEALSLSGGYRRRSFADM